MRTGSQQETGAAFTRHTCLTTDLEGEDDLAVGHGHEHPGHARIPLRSDCVTPQWVIQRRVKPWGCECEW
jgi:hypothetical protein